MEKPSTSIENIIIPWLFLHTHSEKLQSSDPKQTTSKRTFTDALNNVCDIPVSQPPQPVIKRDRIAIKIPEDEYQARLVACKHNFNGRMLWPKGSTPLKVIDLKSKLSRL
jgi:hypothetical protein